MPLILTASNATVWQRTEDALADTSTITDPLKIRCRECGRLLGRMADTKHGPLFTSSWEVQARSGLRIVVDGQELRPRAQRRYESEHNEVVSESGPPVDRPEVHGTIALLALPQAFPQDYPDFMVRCPKHGDQALDRIALLKDLRAGKNVRVELDGARLDYRLNHRGGSERKSSKRVTRRRYT